MKNYYFNKYGISKYASEEAKLKLWCRLNEKEFDVNETYNLSLDIRNDTQYEFRKFIYDKQGFDKNGKHFTKTLDNKS